MPHVSFSRRLIPAVLAAATVACAGDSPTEAPLHPGTYILHSAAGQQAPALIHAITDTSGARIEVFVLGDTVELKSDGT